METIAKGERGGKDFGGGERRTAGEARKIGAATRYDFGGGRLTPYGGLLPLAALWEKLGMLALVGRGLTVKRQPESLSNGQFVLSTVLLFFLGFSLLSRKLCLSNSSGLLKTRLKHGIELSKSRGDAACHGSPATLLQRGDSES